MTFGAEVVHTPADHAQGLSDRESLPPRTGMLFVFQSGVVSAFWMKGMRFALDFVWISADCEVAGVTVDVPPPDPNATDVSLPFYTSPAAAAYTFEINAGEIAEHSIEVGDPVTFSGISADGADC